MAHPSRHGAVGRAPRLRWAGRKIVRGARPPVALVRDAVQHYSNGLGASHGAAVAFFAVLSAAPLLVLAVSIAGTVFGTETARAELQQQLRTQLGPDVASVLARLMDATARSPDAGTFATIAAIVILLLGAGRLFTQLQRGVNAVWGIRQRTGLPMGRTLRKLIRKRLTSFALVASSGLVLMLFLALQTGLAAVATLFQGLVPFESLWHGINLILSFGLLAVVFATIYRVLPDAHIGRKDVWIGAMFTAIAMGVGTLLIGLYLGHVGISSTYGAAGSLVLLLMWVYYSAQAFYFGAAFTRAWSARYGTGIRPQAHAVRIVPEETC
ncbi:MAG: YihY/virulence factor BrkB family protein [Polyangiales bacterium]